VPFDWDVPLLNGYASEFLPNAAWRPGVDRFAGCDTPAVARRIRGGRFDAVLVNGWQLRCYWQAIRGARRCRVPVFVRGDSQLTPAKQSIRIVKAFTYPRMLRSFDGMLAVGQRNREYYQTYGVPDERIWRSPHCVDNAFFAAAAERARQTGAALRERLGIPGDATVYLFAGRLIEKKHPLDFIAALERARAAGARVHGLIVGDGALRAAVEAEIEKRAVPCAMSGFMNQAQIGTAFAAADALVLPSDRRETWGLVVNEAMAAGVPAIVSDAAGCAPDLIVEGRTGFTYPCGDVGALANQLTMQADRQRLAELGRAAAAHVSTYSPRAAAEGVVAAIQATLEARTKREHVHQQPAVA
jgi:glycosyltransferase involved in cell wall biosynthesis